MAVQLAPVTASRVSFRGSKTTTPPKEAVTAKLSDEQVEKMKDVPETIEQVGDIVNDSLNTVNETMQDTTKAVGGIAVTGAGLWATLRKPFVALAEWMKEPLKDADGNIIKEVLKDGKEIIKKSDKYSKNKVIGVAIAAGVVVLSIAASIITKKIKKAKAEELAKQQEMKQAEEQNVEAKKEEGQKLDIVSEA